MKQRTKFFLTYLGGIVTGVVLVFALGFFMAMSQSKQSANNDVVMFEKPRGVVPGKVFEVMQVLPDGSALAAVDDIDSGNMGTVVLFVGNESSSFYDNQNIKVPSGKVAKQVGTYSYMTRQEMEKTMPVVEIMDE